MKLLKSGHRTGAFYLLQAKKKEKKRKKMELWKIRRR